MTKKIIGVGHAIVDIICLVEDNFLLENNLIKGSMTLIQQDKFNKFALLPINKISSGGSVGNTMATLGNLNTNCQFFGIVGDDQFGLKFIEELEKTSCKFIGKILKNCDSAVCFILITPDGERTMCTYLGCASKIDLDCVAKIDFNDQDFLYLEGYLWDGDSTSNSLKKIIDNAKKSNCKIGFTLSDSFCVSRHHNDFINLIAKDLDLVFANEAEILTLLNHNEFNLSKVEEHIKKISIENKKLLTIITRSEKGCCVINNEISTLEFKTLAVDKVIDTTGAGDNFASGWLFYFTKNFSLKNEFLQQSAEFANLLAGNIIKQIGARFSKDQINKLIT